MLQHHLILRISYFCQSILSTKPCIILQFTSLHRHNFLFFQKTQKPNNILILHLPIKKHLILRLIRNFSFYIQKFGRNSSFFCKFSHRCFQKFFSFFNMSLRERPMFSTRNMLYQKEKNILTLFTHRHYPTRHNHFFSK